MLIGMLRRWLDILGDDDLYYCQILVGTMLL
jgi:hypothetical protein